MSNATNYTPGTTHTIGGKVHACTETKLPRTGDYIHLKPICAGFNRNTVATASRCPAGTEVNCSRCLARIAKAAEKAAKVAAKRAARMTAGEAESK